MVENKKASDVIRNADYDSFAITCLSLQVIRVLHFSKHGIGTRSFCIRKFSMPYPTQNCALLLCWLYLHVFEGCLWLFGVSVNRNNYPAIMVCKTGE